jgi:gamma-glutamylcyclotransferase (GGCT)/AIG2-like uncharacterized protein YtfP
MITIRFTATVSRLTPVADTFAVFSRTPDATIVFAVPHYAAYGSNLDPARMRAYCPQSPMVGTGWLEGWRLTFAGEGELGSEGAVTTVVEAEGERVFVAVYDVDPFDAAQLDEIEGAVAGTYRKLHVRVATLDGEQTCWVYVFNGYEGGLPTAWYLSEIANAAEKAGAPDDYLTALRSHPIRTST